MRLSVVVTVVDGGTTLRRCLAALAAQQGAPEMEVIVPCDDSDPGAAAIVAEFPGFRHLAMGTLTTASPATSPAGQHELFDRRRSAGLAAARGELIAMLEDRGAPRPDWARAASELHASLGNGVLGGAVENAVDRTLNWAVYFCDFGRYELPLPEGPAAYAADVNICYKRAAIESTRDLWKDRYHETTVHWALQRAGEPLYLHPRLVVDQAREGLRLGAVLSERVAWGRLFAYTRGRETGALRRIALAVLSPVLPFVLIVRHARMQFAKRRTFGKFVRASPAMFAMLAAWSLGEMAGYATGRP